MRDVMQSINVFSDEGRGREEAQGGNAYGGGETQERERRLGL